MTWRCCPMTQAPFPWIWDAGDRYRQGELRRMAVLQGRRDTVIDADAV
jgi:hypothetical protein